MTAYRGEEAPKPIPCGGCGKFIQQSTASYALDGSLCCPACASSSQIEAAQERGRQGMSFNNNWVRVAIVIALVLVRLLLRFG